MNEASAPDPASNDQGHHREARARRTGASLFRNWPVLAGAAVLIVVSSTGGAVASRFITSADIKDKTIQSRDLATNSVNARAIKAGSVQAWDLTTAARAALKGQPGAPGSKWLTGVGAPGNLAANNGDWYLDTNARSLFTRIGGAWGFVINIGGIKGDKGDKGDPGTPGTNGTNGADGKDGSAWLSGTTAPADTLGKDGDWYLDTATSNAYQKTTGTWTLRVNLQGIKGDTGLKGDKGDTGAAGTNGTNGVDGAKGDKGDKGDTGAAGTNGTNGVDGVDGDDGMDGATWLVGSGVPADTLGKDTDLYLNTANSDVYRKASGAWSLLTNIKGQKGDPGTNGTNGTNGDAGTNGTDGATWLTGAGTPDNANGKDTDLYLNTTNGDVYKKTSGSWGTPIANLTGPAGADGSGGGGGGTLWLSGSGAPNPGVVNPAAGAFYLNTADGAIFKADGTNWTAIYTPAPAAGGAVSTQLVANKVGGSGESCPLATSTSPATVAFNNVVTSPSSGNTWTGSNTFTVGSGQGGMFMFQARVLTPDAATATSTVPISLTLQINNTTYGNVGNVYGPYPSLSIYAPAGTKGRGEVTAYLPLNAGDTVKVLCIGANSSTASQPLSANAGSNLTVLKMN